MTYRRNIRVANIVARDQALRKPPEHTSSTTSWQLGRLLPDSYTNKGNRALASGSSQFESGRRGRLRLQGRVTILIHAPPHIVQPQVRIVIFARKRSLGDRDAVKRDSDHRENAMRMAERWWPRSCATRPDTETYRIYVEYPISILLWVLNTIASCRGLRILMSVASAIANLWGTCLASDLSTINSIKSRS